jgi:hypothetical protein
MYTLYGIEGSGSASVENRAAALSRAVSDRSRCIMGARRGAG